MGALPLEEEGEGVKAAGSEAEEKVNDEGVVLTNSLACV